MVTIETVRRLIAVADVRQDPYAVAAACGALLDVNGNDQVAALHYVRAMWGMDAMADWSLPLGNQSSSTTPPMSALVRARPVLLTAMPSSRG